MKSGSSDDSRLVPKRGGCRKLRSDAAALAAYDAAVIFCYRFIDRRSHTYDPLTAAQLCLLDQLGFDRPGRRLIVSASRCRGEQLNARNGD